MASSLITDYINCGLAAARPATPNLATGAFGIYYATDTGAVSIWNGSSWSGLSGSGTVTALTGDVAASGSGSVAATLQVALTPGGRLTPTSNTPVLTADATAQGTIYYAPYAHARVPVYTGSVWKMWLFAQLTLVLNSTDNVSGALHDIFVVNIGGTLTLGTGPAWTNSTTRSAAIALLDGIWTNNASIALRANGSALSGSPFAANTATYLGTIYCTANGQTGMAMKPAAASGGNNNILGVYNAYNRVLTTAICRNSSTANPGAAVTSTSWASLTGTSMRISWVDGLAQSHVTGSLACQIVAPASNNAFLGMSLDSTTAAPQHTAAIYNGIGCLQTVRDTWAPAAGFHFAQQMASVSGGTGNYYYADASTTAQRHAQQIELMM